MKCDCDKNLGEGCPICHISLPEQLVTDPWKHRSRFMRCQTCMHFVLKVAKMMPEQGTRIGRCRKRSPTMDGYPVVFEADWCGDHKIDEEKY